MKLRNLFTAIALISVIGFMAGCENGTTGGNDNGVELPKPSGINAVGGKTYFELKEKITFSITTDSTENGTYVKGTIENGVYGTGDKYRYIDIETGIYTWNEGTKTITLRPESIAFSEGGGYSSGDEIYEIEMRYGPSLDKTAYRSRIQAMLNSYKEQMGDEAFNQALSAMGFSSVTAYINYVVNETFSNKTYGYSFSADGTALFLEMALPVNKGTNEFSGQTYYALRWDWVNDEQIRKKDGTQKYVFTASGYSFTSSWETITGSYAYDSSMKVVWFRPETINGKNKAAYYADITKNSWTRYVDDNAYRAAHTSNTFDIWRIEYNSASKTIGSNIDYTCTHNWEWKITTAATTESEGLETETCTICGETRETRPIPKLFPFLIRNEVDLRKVGTGIDGWMLSSHYILMADITLSQPQAGQSNWIPIGSESDDYWDWGGSSFIGTFDGNEYTITGLTVNNPSGEYQGMFGNIGTGGTVKNLGLVNVTINGSNWTGSVVGFNRGTVENCYVTGGVTGNITDRNNNDVGGVIGGNYGGTVINCNFTGNVTNINGYVGGVAGYNNQGIIEYCYAIGDVSGGEWGTAGGVVGDNNSGGIVKNSFATGNVSGDEAGGVAGINYNIIENCYATGNVSSSGTMSSNGGGIAGSNYGTVKNCYATGNVSGGGTYSGVGGVVGTNGGIIENGYATGKVSGVGFVNGTGGIIGSNRYSIQNCVALNPNVISDQDVGRVIGSISTEQFINLSNNYARSDMSGTWNNKGLDDLDGADIIATQWNSASWWENTANFPSSVWNFRAGLPTLKNMPGNPEQNPILPSIGL